MIDRWPVRCDVRAVKLHMGFQFHPYLKERMSGGFQEGKDEEPLRMHLQFPELFWDIVACPQSI